jgi:hypothetical protein
MRKTVLALMLLAAASPAMAHDAPQWDRPGGHRR